MSKAKEADVVAEDQSPKRKLHLLFDQARKVWHEHSTGFQACDADPGAEADLEAHIKTAYAKQYNVTPESLEVVFVNPPASEPKVVKMTSFQK